MPKKKTQSPQMESDVSTLPSDPVVKTIAKRGSSVPRRSGKGSESASAPAPVTTARAEVTFDQIARRAYEIYQSGAPGGELDHWLAAERELSGT